MLFVELRFVVFFALVFAGSWALRRNGARKAWLLLASWAFYAAWDWRFLGLILFSSALDWVAALRIAAGARRRWLVASLVGNLGVLALFKYFDFFAASAADLSAWLGLPVSRVTLDLVLPVGISFYTFQTLSYTIDVYRGVLAPRRSALDVALFVAFFPQLVAGPIVRARHFLPQLERAPRFDPARVRPLLGLFLVGWVKKACVSDHVSVVADAVFADPAAHGLVDLWLGAFLYAIQIYCDFSGYTDMAIASAGLLGYELVLNFDFPYLARSVTDFWRRWHVSLSTWFRDYLYVPLGGSHRGPARTYANLAIVFLLCGLWHGAAWTFVLWGAWHGLFLIAERRLGLREVPHRAVTLLAVLFGWVLFRSADLATATTYAAGMVGLGDGASSVPAAWWLMVPAFAVGHLAARRGAVAARVRALPDWAWALLFGAAVALALPWAAKGYQPFIYFQF